MIKLFLKWIIIWIANIIPGLSWWTMAVILWIYQKLTETIWNFFTDTKNIKNNTKLLWTIWLWSIFWIGIFVTTMDFLLENYLIFTQLFFAGLIIGSIPALLNYTNKKINIKKMTLLLGWFLIVFWFLYFFQTELLGGEVQEWLVYQIKIFFSGFLTAWSMIIPGFSWSMMLVIMWEYHNMILFLKKLVIDKILIATIWGLFWIVICARIISFLLKKFNSYFYYFIIWMVIGSVYWVMPSIYEIINLQTIEILIVSIIFIIWLTSSYSLSSYFK